MESNPVNRLSSPSRATAFNRRGAFRLLTGRSTPDAEPPRFLSEAQAQALFAAVRRHTTPRGRSELQLTSQWRGDVRWALNRVHTASDWRDHTLQLTRT